MLRRNPLIIFFISVVVLTGCKEPNIQKKTTIEVNEIETFPTSIGYVNDFSGIFSIEQRQELEKQLVEYEQQSTNEIVVVILDSVPLNKDFNTYCVNLSNAWGVGKAGKDNGLIFVLDMRNHRMRINTGSQTSKVLTDEICNLTLNQVVFPNFKQGDYFNGIKYGVDTLVQIWDGELSE